MRILPAVGDIVHHRQDGEGRVTHVIPERGEITVVAVDGSWVWYSTSILQFTEEAQ